MDDESTNDFISPKVFLWQTLARNTVSSLAWSPDRCILALATFESTIRLWDITTQELRQTLRGHRSPVLSLAWSPDRRTLASGGYDRTIRLWDAETGMLWVWDEQTRARRLWNVGAQTVQQAGMSWLLELKVEMLRARDSETGISAWDKEVGVLWLCEGEAPEYTQKRKHTQSLEGHTNQVRSLAWSSDARTLASAADDGSIRLWDVMTGMPLAWDAGEGMSSQTMRGHKGSIHTLAWSPNGQTLASGGEDGIIRLWDKESRKIRLPLEGHTAPVYRVVWSQDGDTVVSGGEDQTIRLWDAPSGKLLGTIEGHRASVVDIAWSPDQRLLASGSNIGSVRIWQRHTWEIVKILEEVDKEYTGFSIHFHPIAPSQAPPDDNKVLLSNQDALVRYWPLDIKALLSVTPTQAQLQYASAKIVLVGESKVGKTCLALRLAENRYEELGITHGMLIRSISSEQLSDDAVALAGKRREVVLWDMGGQEEYQLLHQLFLHDTTLALILVEPRRGQAAFEEVVRWNARLENQLHGRKTVKLLVGTQLDLDESVVDQAGLDKLIERCGFIGYYPTSAKKDRGIAELRRAISKAVDWDELAKRPPLFQRVRDVIDERKKRGEVVLPYSTLEQQVQSEDPNEFDVEAVKTVVKQLELRGDIVNTQLASGQQMLVLQIREVIRYAASLIRAARNNPRGVPAIEEQLITSGKVLLPGIEENRLGRFQELIVLDCVVQRLLNHGICFKHEGLLIFPSLFQPLDDAEMPSIGLSIPLYYKFSGATEDIYSLLIVEIANSGWFGRVRLWKDVALFETPEQAVYGLRKIERDSGSARLDLFFSPQTDDKSRNLFTAFVEDYLRKQGISIDEVLKLTCVCGYHFEDSLVREYVSANKLEIICPRPNCGAVNRISEGAKKALADNPEVVSNLIALQSIIKEKNETSIVQTKNNFKSVKIFISYSYRDEQLRDELVKHLARLKRTGEIETWYDRKIGAGEEWKSEIDRHIDSASVILLLVSSDFIDSDYCYDVEMKRALERHESGEARVIPVILHPVDWQNPPLNKLQALPIDALPVSEWLDRDEAFQDVVEGIRKAIEESRRTPPEPPHGSQMPVRRSWRPFKRQPIRILHLSDLHMDGEERFSLKLQPLIRDLEDKQEGLGIDKLDCLVVSGDLTNRAEPKEFENAYQFISELIKRFGLTAGRCIIVPGNHDLSWDSEVFQWKPKRGVDPRQLKVGTYSEQGDGYLVRDEGKYPKRFENFAKFYHSLTQKPYPLEVEKQFVSLCLPFDETLIHFLALNSAWEIDEFFPNRSSINDTALSNALMEVDEEERRTKEACHLPPEAHVVRIGVWHHPVTGNEQIASDTFLERLRMDRFRLCLHGHVHEDRADVIGYLHPSRKIHVAGAGSFGAPANQRPESTPRLYNVIEIERNDRDQKKTRIHTRCLRKHGGAWEGWAVWPAQSPFNRRTFYEIDL